MSMTGNTPRLIRDGFIRIPSTTPENCRVSTPGNPVTLADRSRVKSAKLISWVTGSTGNSTPNVVILIGSQEGQPSEEPSTTSTLRTTANDRLGSAVTP